MLDVAKDIRAAIPKGVQAFGVFDDSQPRDVGQIADLLELDGVQFPAAARCPGRSSRDDDRAAHRARRATRRDLADVERLRCDAVQLDAYVEGRLGGTGTVAPWDVIEAHRPAVPVRRVGGLTAVERRGSDRTAASGRVDVSSGIETSPA